MDLNEWSRWIFNSEWTHTHVSFCAQVTLTIANSSNHTTANESIISKDFNSYETNLQMRYKMNFFEGFEMIGEKSSGADVGKVKMQGNLSFLIQIL